MYYLTNFCCFCLKERENLIDLSLRNFQHVNIINKLMFCIKDDLDTSKVPTFICQKCCTKLEEAYEFKKMSLGNWNRFQGYIRKLKYVNPNCKTKYVLNEIKILVSDVKLEGCEFKSTFEDDDHTDGCFINEEPVETIESLLVEDKNNRTSEEPNNVEHRTEQLTDENAELSQDFFGETVKEEATIPDETLQRHPRPSCEVNFKYQVKCTHCDETFNTKWHLERHLEKNHKELQCSLCGKRFSLKTSLNHHMLIHENKRPFACSYCDRTFWEKRRLDSHVEKQHRELTDPDNLFSCYQCCKHFPSELELKEHVLIHLNEKPYSCSKCGRMFKDKHSYQRHLYTHNQKIRPYFVCAVCNKRYTTKHSLKYHMIVHSNKPPNAYTIIDKNVESPVKYLKFAEEQTEFRCSLCGRCFRLKSYLTAHIRTHENRRPHACSDCDRTFWKKSFLAKHVAKKHKNHADLLACYKCSERFPSELKLKEHVLIHSDEKPYMCSTCGKGFTKKPSYLKHLYIHNEKDRPYFVCALCNKRYTSKASLKLHLLAHANKLPYACEMCDARFIKKCILRNHILKHHNNSNKDLKETQESKKTVHMLEELHPQNILFENPVKSEPCDGFEFVNIQDGNTPMQETGVSTLLVKAEKQPTLNGINSINENVEEGYVTLNDQDENKIAVTTKHNG